MKPDLYQGSTGEKRSRDLFVFVRVAIAFAMLMVLCAAFDAFGAVHFADGSIVPKCKYDERGQQVFDPRIHTCELASEQELRDAAMLRELKAMRADVRKLESLLRMHLHETRGAP